VLAVQDLLGTNASPASLDLLYFLELLNVEETVGAIRLGLVLIIAAIVRVISLFQMVCVRIALMVVDNVVR
jgi:hypothetical protein